MATPAKELEKEILAEYNRARATLQSKFSSPIAKAKETIQTTLLLCTTNQIAFVINDIRTAYYAGVSVESAAIRDKLIAYTGVNLGRIPESHYNQITKRTIGNIAKYNTTLSKSLQKEYTKLLSNNELVNQLKEHGWTKNVEKRVLKLGLSPEVVSLVKQQATTLKMLQILELNGIRGGLHPDEVGRLLKPHIANYFGPQGVVIDHVGKVVKRLEVDANGNFKWVKHTITKPYHATTQSYSNLIAHTSMKQANVDGRLETLRQSGLCEDRYRWRASLTGNSCPQCAILHGQIVHPNEISPLLHPHCYCQLDPIWKSDTGLMNHSDEYYQKQRDEWFWKQYQTKQYNLTLPKGQKIPNYNLLPPNMLGKLPELEEMYQIRAEMLNLL